MWHSFLRVVEVSPRLRSGPLLLFIIHYTKHLSQTLDSFMFPKSHTRTLWEKQECPFFAPHPQVLEEGICSSV